MRESAEAAGLQTLRVEAPEGRSLPALLAPELRLALLRLSRTAQAKDFAVRALRGLAGFATALKLKYEDIEVGLDFEPEPGLADSGDLEHDLHDLLEAAGEAAKHAGTALVLFVDELQYVEEPQLAALIIALHRATQRGLPVVLVGAGLPQLRGQMGRAKSYAERLFDFPEIGPSRARSDDRAVAADPDEKAWRSRRTGWRGSWSRPMATRTSCRSGGSMPGMWPSGRRSRRDVDAAPTTALAALDERFFRVRFDRLTPAEKRYLRAMAERGPGPHRSGDIADAVGPQGDVARADAQPADRQGHGLEPGHGDTAFTVPLFDEFMRRIMPGDEWRTGQ